MNCEHPPSSRTIHSANVSEGDAALSANVKFDCSECAERIERAYSGSRDEVIAAMEGDGFATESLLEILGFPDIANPFTNGELLRSRELGKMLGELSREPGVKVLPTVMVPGSTEFRIAINVNGINSSLGESEIDTWRETVEELRRQSRLT